MKKLRNAIICFVAMFLFATSVDAATGSIIASTGTKVATVGSTFTVKVRLTCSEALGSWDFGITYDSAYISYVGGSPLHVIDQTSNGTDKTREYTYTFKAIKSGNANIRVADAQMAGYDEAKIFIPGKNSVAVTVKTQAEIQASYSKNNDLKALTVEGYELTPNFNKDTLEYKVSVPDTETSIKVSASVADSTARVSGTGNIDISEGANKVQVIVTAQNGSTKTYTILVDVKDLNPINANVDGQTYTVVKKEDLLTAPVGFSSTTIKIAEIDVPAFKSELANLTLVGLKNESGDIGLYIYDETANTYSPYRELKGNGITLLAESTDEIPDGFAKKEISINGVNYSGFQSTKDDSFYLLYAMNIETGKKDFYIYDAETNGFIKYNSKVYEELLKNNKELVLFLITAAACAGIMLLIVLLELGKINKLKRIIKKYSIEQKEKVSAIEVREESREEETPEAIEEASDEEEVVEPTKRKKGKKKKH